MTLNYQQLIERIREIALAAPARGENLARLQTQAQSLLAAWADQAEGLTEKLDLARKVDPALRCAIPPAGSLTGTFPSPPNNPELTLIAADGSQVSPDRHASLPFSLVNVGAIVLRTGSGLAPLTFTDSVLRGEDELYTETGLQTAEALEQQRDIAEREKLLELARQYPAPVVGLTDGPVELWGAKGTAEDDYRRNLERHRSILSQLHEQDVIVAGYVDKPGADLVVRLLEIATLGGDEQIRQVRRMHPLRGVSDRWLFGQFLKHGERTMVFGLQSSSRSHYSGDLALHFFYLNVGDDEHPWLVRVEVPAWVANDDHKLACLHSILLQQCRQMGARPYPYILHRAHEIAVVGLDEKRQVEHMLALELRQAGIVVGEGSYKQSAKDLPGKGKRWTQ